MSSFLDLLQHLVSVSFVVLGLVAVIDWIRQPSRRRGYIAIALGLLGLVSLLGRVNPVDTGRLAWVQPVTAVAFQLSGLGLVFLRHSFIPVPRWGWFLAIAGLGGTAAASVIVGFPTPPAAPSGLQSAVQLGVVSAWVIAVAEPTLRFWLASRSLAVVQRRRMQALSLGYLGIILILLTAFLPASASTSSPIQVAINLYALCIAPLLWAGFSPPKWLRRAWREAEEEPFRDAIHELLLFSASRAGLADRALEWAVRLVGADFGMLLDGDGTLVAVRGATPEEAAARATSLLGSDNPVLGSAGGLVGGAIILPLPLDSGTGYLMAQAGPFTPVFGLDEVVRLRQYAAAVTAALDRTRVSERVLALEEVKSRFLKLASHELRGPLALVKGYMSMVSEGAISPDELQRVMPMIQGRIEQMNGMLNEMLETARLEDDRLELKAEPFDVRHAVAVVTEVLRPLTSTTHPVRVRVPAHAVNVVADRARVETIVANMIDNAIKYSPRGGDIDCIVEVRGRDALVAVTDHGIGIAGEDMKTLFTRFGRITSDATVSIPGTGLGLYLSRELARMQQGDLTARSQAGEGSTFTLQLPLAMLASP